VILLRALVRVVSFLLLVVLALAGLAAAVAMIDPGGLAGAVGLPRVRDTVGNWLDALGGPGAIDLASVLGGVLAVLLGLALLAGLLIPRRERLLVLRSGSAGTIAARRRALAQVATALVEQTRGVTEAKVKARPHRRRGGRLRVRAARPRPAPAREVERAIAGHLEGLTGPFALKARIHTHTGERGSRVQ